MKAYKNIEGKREEIPSPGGPMDRTPKIFQLRSRRGRLGWGSLPDRARELRGNPTGAEKILWKHLRLKQLGGYRLRRQHPIGNNIVDFFCFKMSLVIEIDGGQHAEQRGYDQERTLWLESRGFKVLRFWNNQIMIELAPSWKLF